MRQFFAAGVAMSLLGATLLGAVYAFTASETDSGTNTVGTASLVLNYTPDGGAILGPNDDSAVIVGSGDVENDGDFDLTLSGAVEITGVAGAPPGGAPACAITDFTGGISGLDASVASGGTTGPFDATIATNASAPDACQGDDVSYDVTITGTT